MGGARGKAPAEEGETQAQIAPAAEEERAPSDGTLPVPRKSLSMAYALWFLFPLLGAHHFYLGRDAHCVLHTLSLGFCGLGWLRDGWMLPSYVRIANEDPSLRQLWDLHAKLGQKRPRFGIFRYLCMAGVSIVFGFMLPLVLPAWSEDAGYSEQAQACVETALSALGVALGVYVVGSIPPISSSFRAALVGAAAAAPIGAPDASKGLTLFSPLFAIVLFRWRARYSSPPQRRVRLSVRRRAAVVVGSVLLAWGVAGVALLQRGYVIDNKTGKTILIKDSLRHFFRSPLWKEMRQTAWRTCVEDLPREGWRGVWERIKESMDLTGATNARRVLGVSPTADFAEVKQAHRALVREHHPDKISRTATAAERQAAEERFREVQSAYETLSQLHRSASQDAADDAKDGVRSRPQQAGAGKSAGARPAGARAAPGPAERTEL